MTQLTKLMEEKKPKDHIQGFSIGHRAGWNSALEIMKKYLTHYKEAEEGFSEYQAAMDDAIKLADELIIEENED